MSRGERKRGCRQTFVTTLDEEKATGKKLTTIAARKVNVNEKASNWLRSGTLGMNVHGEQTRSLWMKVEVYPDAPKFSGKKNCDIAVLPAGTGHQCLGTSDDFLVVGAYPPDETNDECTSSEDHARSVETIPKVGKPRKELVYGGSGPLLDLWKASR